MLELAKAQAARGSQVTVYSAEDQTGSAQRDGFELRSLRCRWSGTARRFEFLIKCLRDVRRLRPEVLHFHSVPEASFFAHRIDARTVLSYDHYLFFRGKRTPLYWWFRQGLRRFDYLLPVSEYCLTNSVSYWGLEGARVRVLFNGVNLNQFHPDSAGARQWKQDLGLNDDPVVMYVGRVCRQKGTDVLLDAYVRVKEKMPNVRLVIAGPAERFGHATGSDLTARIAELGGIYLGAVEEDELARAYNLCDVFVMPTRTEEMFGMAAVEAQACGKPAVCSRHGGLVEVVCDKSGHFFPIGDSAALAEELVALLSNVELRQQMSAAARENAQRFDWNVLAADLEPIYAGH
jgi:glycosyltransferase involved in cell wall biosynthesis